MNAREKSEALATRLRQIKSPQDRLAAIIQMGRAAPGLEEKFKTKEFKLEGCLSNLWVACEMRDGLCEFRADSDSAIVKGLAVAVCELHSALTPREVGNVDLNALRETGLWQQLTPNRRTGMARLVERIQSFAREQER